VHRGSARSGDQAEARITGGEVGPEGSLFAFVAVLVAFGLLVIATMGRLKNDSRLGGREEEHLHQNLLFDWRQS
jgi:hypothetical protein